MSYLRGLPADVEKTRTIPFVFSDETRDSYRTVFTAKDWDLDRFNKNGVALYNHFLGSSDPDTIIGSARAWIEHDCLAGSITFENKELNPLADKLFRKFLNGTLKGVSVRFFPLEAGQWGEGEEGERGSNPTYYIGRRELVEISVTPVPANKNALMRSVGSGTWEELTADEGFFVYGQVRSMSEEDTGKNPETSTSEESQRDIINCIENAYMALGGITNKF